MDDYEPMTRFMNYAKWGAVIGASAGFAGGVFLAEYYYDYSYFAQKSLDVTVGIMIGVLSGIGGAGCGCVLSDLVNYMIRKKEEIFKKVDEEKKDLSF